MAWRVAAVATCCLGALLLCAGQEGDPLFAEIQEDLGRIWQLVAVEKAQRNVPLEGPVPEIRRACQYGLGPTGLAATHFVLRQEGIEELELHDLEDEDEVSSLQAVYGARVRRVESADLGQLGDPGAVPQSEQPPCDLVVISRNSSRFTVERLLHRVSGASHVVVAWVPVGCVDRDGNTTSAGCGFLHLFWYQTVLMRRGYCHRHVCMSRVPVEKLQDPNTFPLDCAGLKGARGLVAARNWSSPAAEFSQDWYILQNFFAVSRGHEASDTAATLQPGGFYVDVGASLGFEYSNSVVLDRCLGWQGLCIEPNGGIMPWISNYRTCQVVHKCVKEEAVQDHAFRGRDGTFAFSADCLPLGEILDRAGLRGRRIDALFIDIEHGEVAALRSMRLQDYDIAVMVIEVSHGVKWLEVETEVLQHGYAKVAVLGRDVVYARLDLLQQHLGFGKPAWRRMEGVFLPGFAAEEEERPLSAAKSRCELLGRRCSGVTCSHDEVNCSARAGRAPFGSPSEEVTHMKVVRKGGPPLATGKVLLPDSWPEFHSRVVEEEREMEESRERELERRGLRRMVMA